MLSIEGEEEELHRVAKHFWEIRLFGVKIDGKTNKNMAWCKHSIQHSVVPLLVKETAAAASSNVSPDDGYHMV